MIVPSSCGKDIMPSFCNGRELRDYQKEGVLFLLQNARENRNSLLGDEMGRAEIHELCTSKKDGEGRE